MRIAVLGAGNGGQAFAGGQTLQGNEVHLAAVPDHADQITIIQTFGGIMVEGISAAGQAGGFARIARVDTDVAAAIEFGEVIFVVVPAFAQEPYLRIIAEHAARDSLVVMEPGKFGSFRLAELLRRQGRDPDEILIAETSTFLYAAKIHGLDHIWLRGVKGELPLAALPARRTAEAVERLRRVHAQYVPATNVLDTSTQDPSYALHPVTTLLNLSRLETMGPYRTRAYDITAQTGRMVEAVDAERCAVAEAYGLRPASLLEQGESMYGLTGATVFEALSASTVHVDQMTPRNARHRYVTEEVPYGLVPLRELGTLAGLDMPATDAIITLASVVNDEDYRSTGRHLETMGLGGLTPEQILQRL